MKAGFLFSLEAAFSLTLAMAAAACLFSFAPQHSQAAEFAACSDAASALAQTGAFASQRSLQAGVDEAGALLNTCVEARGAGFEADSCGWNAQEGEMAFSFSFPVWSGGKLHPAQVSCKGAA